MSKKRGKLSNGEMDYIRQNCFDLSIEEIAEKLLGEVVEEVAPAGRGSERGHKVGAEARRLEPREDEPRIAVDGRVVQIS